MFFNLIYRWRPETHSFHLPCGEMSVVRSSLVWALEVVQLSDTAGPMVGGTESRPSLEDHFLWRHWRTAPQGYQLLGLGRALRTVRHMRTRRQLPTTVELGSCNYLGVFFFLTGHETLHCGCTSRASLTGTPQVLIAGLRECWLTYTVAFVRRAVELQFFHWWFYLPTEALDVVSSPSWTAHSWRSSGMVCSGQPSSPSDVCPSLGPGESPLQQDFTCVRTICQWAWHA